jgi:hypothetical protein
LLAQQAHPSGSACEGSNNAAILNPSFRGNMKVIIRGQIFFYDDDGKKLGSKADFGFDCKPQEFDEDAEEQQEVCILDNLENRTPVPTNRVETLVSAMMDGIEDNYELWELFTSRDLESEVI